MKINISRNQYLSYKESRLQFEKLILITGDYVMSHFEWKQDIRCIFSLVLAVIFAASSSVLY